MYDLIIEKGDIIDGTGRERFNSDIGIVGDRIATIGELHEREAAARLDASGFIVSPGFIDIHSHSDLTLLVNPTADSKILQGVTTEVIGNCGMSPFPVNADRVDEIKRYLVFIAADVEWDWCTGEDYLNALERARPAVNVAVLVGHGTLRTAVSGFIDRGLTPDESRRLNELLEEALCHGAFGMSSGLIYPPGSFSSTEELVEACKVLKPYGGIYATHIRNERSRLLESISEAIEIGRRAEIPVQISHLKAAGSRNWGTVEKALELIDRSRASGVDVAFDVYPYTAGSTQLSQLLPPWVSTGGPARLLERLKDPIERGRIREEITTGTEEWESLVDPGGWDKVVLASVEATTNKPLEGKTIREIAEIRGIDPAEAVLDILVEEKLAATMVIFTMDERDVVTALQHPCAMIGSDAKAVAPRGELGKGKPHPRHYGSFPKVLGEFVREKKALRLEEAIKKMTALPAERLGLVDRGKIGEGMKADLTIFNPRTVRDNSTFADPHRFPEGIEFVIVNGVLTAEKGRLLGGRAGRILRNARAS